MNIRDELINQLRFENECLHNLVETNKLPDDVKEWIDCTHRNTELLKENIDLQIKIHELNEMNEKNYNNYCKLLGENHKLKEKITQVKQLLVYYMSDYFKESNGYLLKENEIKEMVEILEKVKEGKYE